MRYLLIGLILGIIAGTALSAPNIVFILVDDLDVTAYKTAITRDFLPNIKAELINKGTSFENSFVSQPLCCPSRATLQTGQYPQNHEVIGNNNVYAAFKANKESTALATWMQGYRTGYMGKYLNGSGDNNGYVPPGWEDWQAAVLNPDQPESVAQCMYGITLANGSGRVFYGNPDNPFDPATYQTDVLAQRAEIFIGNPDTRPFFLIVAPTAPHIENCKGRYKDSANTDDDPLTKSNIRTAQRYADTEPSGLPAARLDSYDELDVSDKPRYFVDRDQEGSLRNRKKLFNEKVAAMRPIDDMVKRIIDQLTLTGKLNNTLIIFASDNGYQYGTHRMTGKQDLYEESIRVPLVVRAPGQTTRKTKQEWILNNDWAPTIADYASATPQIVMDGKSFKPLLEGTTYTQRQTIMVRTGANPASPLFKRGKYFIAEEPGDDEHVPYLAIRTKNPLLTGGSTMVYGETYYNTAGTDFDAELYDLQADPYQLTSQHANPEKASIAAALKAHLMLMKTCSGETCRALEE